MEKFFRGLFANSEIYIGNQETGTLFTVKEIGLLTSPTFTDEMTFQTLSPIHVRYTNPRNGKIEYLHPDHREFERVFADNLRHKLEAWHEHIGTPAPDTRFTELEILSEPRSRLITIKERSLHETRIKAYDFRFRIKASPLLLEAGYFSGLPRVRVGGRLLKQSGKKHRQWGLTGFDSFLKTTRSMIKSDYATI